MGIHRVSSMEGERGNGVKNVFKEVTVRERMMVTEPKLDMRPVISCGLGRGDINEIVGQ